MVFDCDQYHVPIKMVFCFGFKTIKANVQNQIFKPKSRMVQVNLIRSSQLASSPRTNLMKKVENLVCSQHLAGIFLPLFKSFEVNLILKKPAWLKNVTRMKFTERNYVHLNQTSSGTLLINIIIFCG